MVMTNKLVEIMNASDCEQMTQYEEEIARLQAEAAALRCALEAVVEESYGALGWLQGVVHFSDTARLYKVQKLAQAIEEANAALAADAGRAMLERVRMLEEELELSNRAIRTIHKIQKTILKI